MKALIFKIGLCCDMARYFFHLDDGQKIEDHSGNELLDEGQAREIAAMLADKFAQTDMANKTPSKWFIVVTDEEGSIIHRAYPKSH